MDYLVGTLAALILVLSTTSPAVAGSTSPEPTHLPGIWCKIDDDKCIDDFFAACSEGDGASGYCDPHPEFSAIRMYCNKPR